MLVRNSFHSILVVLKLRVVILESAEAVTKFAADHVAKLLPATNSSSSSNTQSVTNRCTLGLATGGTPLGLYQELIRRCQEGHVSFAGVTSFNLDEYVGLKPDDPQSYRYYMNENLFQHVNIDISRTHVPNAYDSDLHGNAARYEELIKQSGGIDLQILGIGTDAHIGFNEIGSSLASRTRVKTLTTKTRTDNARYFGSLDEVPTMAVTMGIGTIMEARSILLLATGSGKATAIKNSIEGPITASVPASVLQWHPNATIVVDEAAAHRLENSQYYKDSEANRRLLEREAQG